MIALYLALYATALALMIVGCIVPAVIIAVAAHSIHRLPTLVRVKPIRDIHG